MKFYAFGIVDKNGKPYFSESCICKDSEVLRDEVIPYADEDYPELAPHRTVKLLFDEETIK